jgi:ribosomal protein S18 acetylase RimI-like enzyme
MPEERARLVGDYTLGRIDAKEFQTGFDELRHRVFADTLAYDPRTIWTQQEKEALARLRARMGDVYELVVGIYRGGELVGWSMGWQEDAATYKMVNTGILPEHQGRGIYKALLPHLLGIVKQEGFQVVVSYHCATNNAVIVPKLRAGFLISGFEVSDRFGLIVRLAYYFNETRRRIMDVRVGQTRPDDEIKRILGL